MKSLGIRSRILLAAIVPAVLVASIIAGALIHQQANTSLADQHSRIGALARQLAVSAQYHIFSGDRLALQSLLQAALTEPDVLAVAVLDAPGNVLASTLPAHLLPKVGDVGEGFEPGDHVDHADLDHWHALPVALLGVDEIDLFSQYGEASQPVGRLLVQISGESLQAKIRNDALTAASFTLLILMLALLITLGLSQQLITTLDNISHVVTSIRRGERGNRVGPLGNPPGDELGQLADGIDAMADAVEQTQEQLAARIAKATEELRLERDAAAEAAAARSRFFAAASHDLRQPIHALGLFVNRLELDAGKTRLQPAIKQVARSVKALRSLIDTLLDYSRLSGKVVQIQPRPVWAADACGVIHDEFVGIAAEKQLTLRLRVNDGWLLTDPILLHRILLNLVSNAIRHTEAGGVLIACRRGADHARIEIWDTGAGIPLSQQEAIFDELVQLRNPERDPEKGLGLGLPIVRRTAELLGHRLTLRSREGQGSCFALEIPLSATPAEAADDTDEADRDFILVLSRTAADRGTHVSQLQRWGYSVFSVSTKEEAQTWVAAFGPPALLICETGGNIADTRICLQQLENHGELLIPAILIHPGPLPTTAARGIDATRHHLLSRPYGPARLRALVEHLLYRDATD